MIIEHRPFLDPQKVERVYSEKDGVPVRYVCTSALDNGTLSMDIFYRTTPHPDYGNRYFGLYVKYMFDNSKELMITNADSIEDVTFEMVQVGDKWHYSQDRHDFHTVGDVSLDGGREYLRMVGNLSHPTKTLRVKNGEFIEDSNL